MYDIFLFVIILLLILQMKARSGSVSSMSSSTSDADESLETWSSKRAGILSKYTTSEKLTITTSFLSASDKEKGNSKCCRIV